MYGEVPRTRNAKREYCQRCDSMATFLFDHGLGYFICAECELD
jgi:hypothetical protein